MSTTDMQKTASRIDPMERDTAVWRQAVVPPADAYETRDSYVLEMDMPGAEEKGIEVTAENGILSVRATADTSLPAGMTELREEVPARRWHRSFDLGDGIDAAGIRAKFSRGVLRLTLPKHEMIKARRIAIAGE